MCMLLTSNSRFAYYYGVWRRYKNEMAENKTSHLVTQISVLTHPQNGETVADETAGICVEEWSKWCHLSI
jgi:hypothetical protein